MIYPIKKLSIYFFLFVISCSTYAQRINTGDIENFWKAYDALAQSQDSVKTFQELYLNPGSQGLKDFSRVRDLQATDYVRNAKKYPAFWKSMRSRTLEVISQKNSIEDALNKLQQEYSKLKYPEVYFLIGKLNSGGTTGKGSVLIGCEVALADSSVTKHEFEPWMQSLFTSKKNIPALVIHETTHVQQRNSLPYIFQGVIKRKVYAACIREGAADFVSNKITNALDQTPLYRYGNEHFIELKAEFEKSMYSSNTSHWLYNGNYVKDKPADLGYFMGYKICEAYYEKAPNKKRAFKKIIQTKNPKKILRKSGLFK